MIGLRFPKLFYGRKLRQQTVGDRADFCEFCVAVCRHQVISFQSAPTVFFVPSTFEEYKRESRCEICRTQFPMALDSQYDSARQPGQRPIEELIAETNPDIIGQALTEARQMVERADDPLLFQSNRIRNLLRTHESEYHNRIRDFFPLMALSSIQALIVGFLLFLFVEKWLAFAFAGSAYVLVLLSLFVSIRSRIFKTFSGSISRLQALTELDWESLDSELNRLQPKFPNSASLFRRRIRDWQGRSEPNPFIVNQDFIQILTPALAHQKSSLAEGA